MAKTPKRTSRPIRPGSERKESRRGHGDKPTRGNPESGEPKQPTPPQQITAHAGAMPQADLIETQWEPHPFALDAFMKTKAPDVELLTNDDCEFTFQSRFHAGVTVYVHARYDWCPVLRAYCRVGIGPDGRPYWLVERTDGAKFAAKYPRPNAQDCFDHFLAVLRSFKAAVNNSPHSPSFCHLGPQDFTVADRLKKIFPDFTSDLCDLGLDVDE